MSYGRYKICASTFMIEISGVPNSSPAKSLFSPAPFRAQSAQIPNSPPPNQNSNRPSSHLVPHLRTGRRRRRRWSRCMTAPKLRHLRPRPPHWVVHRQCEPPQPTCFTDTDFHRIRSASPTPSSTLPGLLHQAHRRTPTPPRWCFTNGLVHRIVALRRRSRSASVGGQPTQVHHPQRL